MGFLSIVGNSFGCSASGERLVSAARDGDLQEAKALLEYNPIVSLLLESGVEINLRNFRGQTALMQACQYGHWEVVQTLILFKANTDYLNGGTALHFAALNGHTRCIRLLLADYVPSSPQFWNSARGKSTNETPRMPEFDESALSRVVNKWADGGITALHMAALNGHLESVRLLLDLGARAGSTPLHYAACGGSAQCCQILIARGACLNAENANGLTPLMVARSWHRNWLESILSKQPEGRARILPSPYLSLPLMSVVKIARECGWRNAGQSPACIDPCAVCLERRCTVSAEGCGHEFCTRCALYLCSTNSTSTVVPGPPGSIACPLCRNAIVAFGKVPAPAPSGSPPRRRLPSYADRTPTARGSRRWVRRPFRSLSSQKFPSMRLNSCMRAPETRSSLVRSSRARLRRSASHVEGRRSWLVSLNQCVTTGS
ncbi:unnamed protein product [Spirodela intermedia]|uniref:RING-type E3 ubiquitin transferase n=1 Tax=Spirodela intermedia TaxID=51605 RepID=A0A7I8JLK4_SPIIN|nr:unnamed protein product [Spirodela intermedia]CAA6671038.1 unnamed protein product [Spirodela intermedia]